MAGKAQRRDRRGGSEEGRMPDLAEKKRLHDKEDVQLLPLTAIFLWRPGNEGDRFLGHILVYPDAPELLLRGGMLKGTDDGYERDGAKICFRLTEEWAGLEYLLLGKRYRVKAEIRFPAMEGNHICPICGIKMREEVSCPYRKKNICIRHCQGCPWNRNYRCIYRTAEKIKMAPIRRRAETILEHMKFVRKKGFRTGSLSPA